jgi:hypothetical protein
VRILGDNTGFWGWSQPKSQDHNSGKNVHEISDCLEVSGWVFIPQISSKIFHLLINVCARNVILKLCWFL